MKLLFLYFYVAAGIAFGQSFPLASSLTSGVGTVGSPDPVWQVSSIQASIPSNTLALTYTNAMIANPCTPFGGPFSWVYPSQLSLPFSNGHWILPSIGCTGYTGYLVYRLTLDLPSDCNGLSLSNPGFYTISLSAFVDNKLADVRINNVSEGINLTNGSYIIGHNIPLVIDGPWVPGINYIDLIVNNFAGPGGIFIGGISTGCIGALPVELTDFEVKNNEDEVVISWETQSENNNDYFLLEKSNDTYTWKSVSKIPSQGNSVNRQSYSFIDTDLNCNETIYYRLIQVDTDQNMNMSTIQSVSCISDCELFPNPATNEITITSKERISKVAIFNLKNELIKTLDIIDPAVHQTIDISEISSGVYLLKINELTIEKLIINK
jgi:Secretion system C-terminal sorting domain